MKRFTLALVATLLNMPVISRADTLTLTPTADSTVDALNPNAEISTGNLLSALTGPNGQPATALSMFYVQYQMPAGITGQNVASINSIDLQLTRSAASPALSLTYYVYGVFEGFDSETANTYTWNDGIGFDPSHKEVRFLTVDEISYYSDPAESGFVGFIDTASEGPPLRPFGFSPVQSQTAVQNLQDLVLNDTDGRLTFFVKVRQNFGVTSLQTFASTEHATPATNAPPKLLIDFVARIPSIAGDYNGNGTVDAPDLTVWKNDFGQSSVVADGDGDGDSDGNDFLIWQRRLGATSLLTVASAVPEPAAAGLICFSMLFLTVTYRRPRN